LYGEIVEDNEQGDFSGREGDCIIKKTAILSSAFKAY
jgi:hypothetical protein